MSRQIGWSQEANLLYQISALITRLTQVTAANAGGGGGGLEPYVNFAAFPLIGTAGITYVAADTDYIYYWDGAAYVQIGGSASALGSVGLTMPSAFAVANSPLVADGTLAVTANGVASQYIRGDGQLASFPDIAGGGGGQVYYLNGGTSQGTISGTPYYQLSVAANLGPNVDFTSGNTDGVIFANFITDVGKPTQETIPAGVWIFQCYISQNNNGAPSSVYATVEVYDGTTFTVISTSLAEVITGGTGIDLYTFTCAVPEYAPLVPADRVAIRFYATGLGTGRTVTLHTQNTHLSSIQTTFTTGIAALDGLTAASQYFSVGSAGTDFDINSLGDTHTFNIPTASAVNRGLLSPADYITFSSSIAPAGSATLSLFNYYNFV
jgi:hypothetical protein